MRESVKSLISKNLPNLVTLAGACYGLESISSVAQGELQWGFAYVLMAIACDTADGRLARRFSSSSVLGSHLDSLCDVISFGVSPAMCILTLWQSSLSPIVAFTYLCCAIWRLAKFSAEPAIGYFKGLPSPVAALIVWTFAILCPTLAAPTALIVAILMVTDRLIVKKP